MYIFCANYLHDTSPFCVFLRGVMVIFNVLCYCPYQFFYIYTLEERVLSFEKNIKGSPGIKRKARILCLQDDPCNA